MGQSSIPVHIQRERTGGKDRRRYKSSSAFNPGIFSRNVETPVAGRQLPAASIGCPTERRSRNQKTFPKPGGRKKHSSPVLPPRSGARLSFTPFPVLTDRKS